MLFVTELRVSTESVLYEVRTEVEEISEHQAYNTEITALYEMNSTFRLLRKEERKKRKRKKKGHNDSKYVDTTR
jgi:hypothetical protein